MRVVSFCILIIFLSPLLLCANQSIDHSKWDQILKRYVHEGLVDYQTLFQSRSEIDDYLEQIENVSVEALADLNREERIAFWINLYNASVIKMILDEYPVKRLDEIPAFFEVRAVRAIGEFFNLAELRDYILRKGFRDERILLALVSGRMDSPKLLEEAFEGDKLEEQLNTVSHRFVEDGAKNLIQPGAKKILLSPLFLAFGSDSLLNYGSRNSKSRFSREETAVISFILDHLRNSEKRLFLDSGRYKIDYLPEDSRLNDIRNA